jgi:hypothetical protein
MQGLYEQVGARLSDPGYIMAAIPFANQVFDYPSYNKDLMMVAYGRRLENPEDTGVMNSLFAGEALAIGGYPLAIASPVIVALNLCAALLAVFGIVRWCWRLRPANARHFTVFVVTYMMSFTGDFSGLFLLKWPIMLTIFSLAVWIGVELYRNGLRSGRAGLPFDCPSAGRRAARLAVPGGLGGPKR